MLLGWVVGTARRSETAGFSQSGGDVELGGVVDEGQGGSTNAEGQQDAARARAAVEGGKEIGRRRVGEGEEEPRLLYKHKVSHKKATRRRSPVRFVSHKAPHHSLPFSCACSCLVLVARAHTHPHIPREARCHAPCLRPSCSCIRLGKPCPRSRPRRASCRRLPVLVRSRSRFQFHVSPILTKFTGAQRGVLYSV
jgi:hypothetical protein